ncbi:hypothetical protein NE237_030721 [Protea cynaroides]|uniref:Leucine zipper homeobox-associated domain-containing protein n=1 Tax=Protea cynaroides TaxID=273540 RepID=A0A9Q0GYE9_9MAGN|nr:hypothetical protein NE237_030721 [Protea cynaroides]
MSITLFYFLLYKLELRNVQGETRSFLKGIDVNRLPSTAECEEEAGVSSPNSTISSVSRKRSKRDTNGENMTKLKQTKVDCEFLKRCCENITGKNRRLQKEVQELRALKLSPQFYMHMTPPTTLTMCPSYELVTMSSTSSASTPLQHQLQQQPPQRRQLRPLTPTRLSQSSIVPYPSTHGLPQLYTTPRCLGEEK